MQIIAMVLMEIILMMVHKTQEWKQLREMTQKNSKKKRYEVKLI